MARIEVLQCDNFVIHGFPTREAKLNVFKDILVGYEPYRIRVSI